MRFVRLSAGTVALLFLAGCATGPGKGFGADYTPVIDMKGVDISKYNTDLSECRTYAQQLDAGGNAVAGAVAGAALLAALSAASGNRGMWNRRYAAGGAIAGAAGAGAAGIKGQRDIIGRCMIGRGYNVLG